MPPSVIFFNGQVVTMGPDQPQAQALAVQGDIIIAVGDDQEITALAATAIHALGDRGLDTVLDALQSVLDDGANVYRHRIEHNRLIRPDQLPRYGELGVLPVVFGEPATCGMLDGGGWSGLLDDEAPAAGLRPWFDPLRSLLDANPGLPVAWHSDVPFFALEPLTHLWTLVTRKAMREDGSKCEAPDWLVAGGVTVSEALQMMTINGAYLLHLDEQTGSLRPGKFADLIILSENPLAIDPDGIVDLEVLVTMVGGSVEHCSVGHDALCPNPGP